MPLRSESFVFSSPLYELKDTNTKAVTLNVVFYGYETWSLTRRVEHRLAVFRNRTVRRIFGPKREEAAGGWRKPHNEELHIL